MFSKGTFLVLGEQEIQPGSSVKFLKEVWRQIDAAEALLGQYTHITTGVHSALQHVRKLIDHYWALVPPTSPDETPSKVIAQWLCVQINEYIENRIINAVEAIAKFVKLFFEFMSL